MPPRPAQQSHKGWGQVAGANAVMAEEEAIKAAGGYPGFMSPIGVKEGTLILVDPTVMNMANAVAGANEADHHYKNVNPKRDFGEAIVTDIRMIQEGDACPRCGQPAE